VEWLNDRVQAGFSRHEAPVLTLPNLKNKEIIYLLTGIIPNRKGQPLIQKWFGVSVVDSSFKDIEPLAAVLQRTGLGAAAFSNPGNMKVNRQAQDLLPNVIHKAQTWMKNERKSFEDWLNPQLNEQLKRLEALKDRHLREIQRRFSELNVAESIKKRRKGEKEREVEGLFAEYMDWIEETMSTEEQAYIKVGAVLQKG
jgi:hypothetical protein